MSDYHDKLHAKLLAEIKALDERLNDSLVVLAQVREAHETSVARGDKLQATIDVLEQTIEAKLMEFIEMCAERLGCEPNANAVLDALDHYKSLGYFS